MDQFRNLFPKLHEIYTVLSKKKNLKMLTYFLLLNLLFMFVEVIYGLLSNCLGLLTDGAHMLLDCSAVMIGLYSSYLSEFKANNNYNYGYFRSEVIGTFINSVFLFFIAIYIVFESIERFIEPKEIHSENLILVSFIGLLVNIVGLFFAHDDGHEHHHHGHSHEEHNHQHEEHNHEHEEHNHEEHNHEGHNHEHGECHHEHEEEHHGHGHGNENIYAIYIHILADTLGSVAVLITAFLIKYYKLYISDPICSLFISVMIIYSTLPVLKSASMVLLHIPKEKLLKKKKKIEESIKGIKSSINSKPSIGNFDLWQTNSSHYIAEIKLNVPVNENELNLKGDDSKESKLTEENKIFFEVQSKVEGIMKDNKIDECFIEVS